MISKKVSKGTHFIDFTYHLDNGYVEVYVGKLNKIVSVHGDENALYWSDTNCDFFNMEKIYVKGKGIMVDKTRKRNKWKSVFLCFLILCTSCGSEPAIEEVISAYAEYLQQFCDDSDTFTAQRIRFSLIYIDENNVPELAFFDDDSHPSGAHICVYSDGTVIEIGEFGSFGSISYSPHENIFLGGFTNMGENITSVYHLSENECVELQYFHSYPQYDENHEYVKDIYEVDGKTVSEEADREAWEQWEIYEWESLSYDDAVSFTDVDSACKEMKKLLWAEMQQ